MNGSGWSEATPLQKRMLRRIWQLQSERDFWGNLGDGIAALGRLARQVQRAIRAARARSG